MYIREVRADLRLVGHDEGELRVHGGVPNKVPRLDRVPADHVSLAVTQQATKEDPQGFRGSGVGVVPVILQNVKLVVRTAEIHLPIERQKGECLPQNMFTE